MSINYIQAVDEMFGLVYNCWKNNTTAIVGYIPPIVFQNNDDSVVLDLNLYVARARVRPITSPQVSLSDYTAGMGKRRFRNEGLLYLEISGPKGYPESSLKIRELGNLILGIFRTKTANCWFKNAVLEELPFVNGIASLIVSVEYSYDEAA